MNTERGKSEAEHQQRIKDYYKEAQAFYRLAWHGPTNGLHYGLWTDGTRNRYEAILNENRVLADLAGINEGDVVLDAGCGIGGSGVWLAENRGASVIGLNIVPEQLKEGEKIVKKRGLVDKVKFRLGNYQDMPLPNESVDVVWSLESIEHASDIERFIQESHRVLKPRGRMVVAATFLGESEITPEQQRQMELGQAVAGCFNDFRTADAVAQVMQSSGFSDVTNTDRTAQVMRSSRQMTTMCRLGVLPAKAVAALRLVPRVMVLNTVWGTYQEGLFRAGATSYNTITATKPHITQSE